MQAALLSETERVLLLKTMPTFADLDTFSARKLGRFVNDHVVTRGTYLLEQGEVATKCYFLPHNACDVFVDDERVGSLDAAGSVGLWSLLSGASARCSVRARRDLVAMTLEPHIAFQLWEANFGLMHETLAHAAERTLRYRDGLPFDPANPPPANGGPPIDHPLDLTDKLEIHLQNSFYRKANLEAVAEICRGQEEERRVAGEVLWSAGDAADFFYRIAGGTVEISRKGRALGCIGAGNAFGLFEALANRPRSYGAKASSDVVLLRTELTNFLEIHHDHFELAGQLFHAFHAAAPAAESHY